MSAHQFCTDLALARGEPIEGTGAISPRVLLMRHPRGKWRVPKAGSPGLSPVLAEAVAYAVSRRPYLTFVDRIGGSDDRPIPALTSFPESVAIDSDDDGVLAATIRDWADNKPIAGRPETRITILCCTDSRTDACCARYGFATYKALVAEADPAKFNVLQSSHIGGCRFASSIALPGRRERYGRMTPEDVPKFLAAIGEGKVWLPKYKGRADLDEPEQVAEIAARRWAAKAGHDGATIGVSKAIEDGSNQLRFMADVGGIALTIRLEARDFIRHGGCEDIREGPGLLVRRWLVREVVAG